MIEVATSPARVMGQQYHANGTAASRTVAGCDALCVVKSQCAQSISKVEKGCALSVRVMTRVWDDSPEKGPRLLILLALADAANDEGVCWPKVATLAKKTRLTERSVQRHLMDLQEAGQLRVYRGGFLDGRNQASTYQLLDPRGGDNTVTTPPTAASPRGATELSPHVEPSGKNRQGNQEASAPPFPSSPALPGLEPPAPPQRAATAIDAATPAEERVWAHYEATFGDRLRVKALTPPRQRAIRKALKAVEDDVDLCCRAIDGLRTYRSKNPKGSQNVALSVVFETGPNSSSNLTEQIEWWASQAETSGGHLSEGGAKVPTDLIGVNPVVAGQIKALRGTAVEGIVYPDRAGAKERSERALEELRERFGHEPIVEGGNVRGWRGVMG